MLYKNIRIDVGINSYECKIFEGKYLILKTEFKMNLLKIFVDRKYLKYF